MNFDHAYADYLDAKAIGEIQNFEKETGKRLLAFYAPPTIAALTVDQTEKLKAMERKLCVRLVAYDSHD